MRGIILFCMMLLWAPVLPAQQYGFEPGASHPFRAGDAGSSLAVVTAPYKEGSASLRWSWTAPSALVCDYTVAHSNFRDGVIFWVYNERPAGSPLRIEYRDAAGQVQYQFEFGLNYTGWRICRIGSKYMKGPKKVRTGLKMHLLSPATVPSGRLFIDRFSFVVDVNYQNAPDAQQPDNTEEQYITHWNSLWKWESELTYATSVPASLTTVQRNQLATIAANLSGLLPASANSSLINAATSLFANSSFAVVDGFLTGKPLVVKPDKTADDHSLAELGTMMMGFAQDALYTKNPAAEEKFLLLWRYALDQGFARGSAMGNNHHYGYETRSIFAASYLMRDVLARAGVLQQVADALGFWSGLPESRSSLATGRDGVVDSWNTLLLGRLMAALMIPAETESYRAVRALIDWTSSSLLPTPGNMGGLKPDGAVFHHAGHYPAYAIGGFEGLTSFLMAVRNSGLSIEEPAKASLAKALTAMKQYTHTYDWTIGLSGRHPHAGAMTAEVLERAQLLGLITDTNPQGFFVMNHAALGVYRTGSALVTLKGYNSDVWGSEIYTADNRYGRYQSHGAVEILNAGDPVSRAASRFAENGWDWNKLPGTTAVQLPLSLLESPQTSTLMARSPERFAGASSLLGQFGVFGMKLHEQNDINNTNYTSDFKARKSVFATGKRLICLGTGIQTARAHYPVETTLFQQVILSPSDRVSLNGSFTSAEGFLHDAVASGVVVVSDMTGNQYRVAGGNRLVVEGKLQHSRHNKTKAENSGNFLSARIHHGIAPAQGSYEYMVMLKPTPVESRRWTTAPAYRVVRADNIAHAVFDSVSDVTAWVCFDEVTVADGLLRKADAETLLMYRPVADRIVMSVTDPALHLPEKTKNSEPTYVPGTAVFKTIELRGNWELPVADDRVAVEHLSAATRLTVKCRLGDPVEFTLQPVTTSVPSVSPVVRLFPLSNGFRVAGPTTEISVYYTNGQLACRQSFYSDEKYFRLAPQVYVVVASVRDASRQTFKLVIG
ncbi:MAG: hypothetical protein LWW91_04805 [Bacteroidales bacterium]|nr:hypothetical protein [Bacteroidales bacterium]